METYSNCDTASYVCALIARTFTAADVIYVDTCTVVHDVFTTFVTVLNSHLAEKDVKFTILRSVERELYKHAQNPESEIQEKAIAALSFIRENPRYFIFVETPHCNNEIADFVLYKMIASDCYEKNQILLTQDVELTRSVFNFCNGRSGNDKPFSTRVFFLDRKGLPTQYQRAHLQVSEYVELEFWAIRPNSSRSYLRHNAGPAQLVNRNRLGRTAATSCTQIAAASMNLVVSSIPLDVKESNVISYNRLSRNITVPYVSGTLSADRFAIPSLSSCRQTENIAIEVDYMQLALSTCVAYMDCSALSSLLKEHQGIELLNKIAQMQKNNRSLHILVLSSFLNVQLIEQMRPWMNVFRIVDVDTNAMSEADALLYAMYTVRYERECRHLLLITNNPNLYENIKSRVPSCFHIPQLWGVKPTKKGNLKKIKQQ